MDELKPCPFCGGKAIYTNVDGRKADCETSWCVCGQCDMVGIPYAVNFWNSRPIEDALRAELAAAREALNLIRMVAGNKANPEADKAVIAGIVGDFFAAHNNLTKS